VTILFVIFAYLVITGVLYQSSMYIWPIEPKPDYMPLSCSEEVSEEVVRGMICALWPVLVPIGIVVAIIVYTVKLGRLVVDKGVEYAKEGIERYRYNQLR